MKTADFDYDLPASCIAQAPALPRDSSRLLVMHRADGRLEHRRFHDIGDYVQSGDFLVANDSRVLPARLHGHKPTGGAVELLLLRRRDGTGEEWECLVKGRGMAKGAQFRLVSPAAGGAEKGGLGRAVPPSGLQAYVLEVLSSGARLVRFAEPIEPYLAELGEIPLPPYITAYQGDPERYQTVYSRPEGSAAAPTAGLHFTPELLLALRRQGVSLETGTLHVGLDTFRPVTAAQVEEHEIHSEWATLSADTARRINDRTLQGGRVIAVGTTTARLLEWAATSAQGLDPYRAESCPWQRTAAFAGFVDRFIRPGYRFRAVDALITNFHLPRSSLLMMVSAFVAQAFPDDPDAGRRLVLATYEEAKSRGYRFFSFGDAMLIL